MQITTIEITLITLATNIGTNVLHFLINEKKRRTEVETAQQTIVSAHLKNMGALLEAYELSAEKNRKELVKSAEYAKRMEEIAERMQKELEDMQEQSFKQLTHNKELEELVHKMEIKLIEFKNQNQTLSTENQKLQEEIAELRKINSHNNRPTTGI